MLSKAHVIKALDDKRDRFDNYGQHAGLERQLYETALTRFESQTRDEVETALEHIGNPNPGAHPTIERVAGRSIVIPFEPRWANHQKARAWAMCTLCGVPTLAVDGSQISPSRDFSVPVGAVQVSWFENPHDAEGRYTKDICFEVLPPEELADDEGSAQGFPDRKVNVRRFELECQVLAERMRCLAGREPRPVCFFDGSLIISFAAQMSPDLRNRYLRAVRLLLDTSEDRRVPLVGYIDTSYARDLVSMLHHLHSETTGPSISDGALLHRRMAWGDRSEAFACARDDKLFESANEHLRYYDRVLFVYLKTTATNPPARLDIPAWVLDEGLLGKVLDVVRAECVVGIGYPYAVETADATAVITIQDRERFYRLFQEFAERLGLDLGYSRKAYSKRGRR